MHRINKRPFTRLALWARRAAKIAFPLSFLTGAQVWAADIVFADPTQHETRVITVEPGVALETLDWGGSGSAMVLLPGLGGTAHVYDEIAVKLRDQFHVYGITPRGFGKSSVPQDGYDTDHLSEDVLRVLDALKLKRVILVGHSIAGLEMSAFAFHYPERVLGLVYLDTTYLFDPGDKDLFGVAEWGQDLHAVRNRLDALESQAGSPDPAIHQLINNDWPQFQRDLEQLINSEKARPPFTPPSGADLANFAAFRNWFARVQGFAPPEAELREQFAAGPGGEVASQKAPQWVSDKVIAGQKKYAGITRPVLAIFAVQDKARADLPDDDDSRRAVAACARRAAGGCIEARHAVGKDRVH